MFEVRHCSITDWQRIALISICKVFNGNSGNCGKRIIIRFKILDCGVCRLFNPHLCQVQKSLLNILSLIERSWCFSAVLSRKIGCLAIVNEWIQAPENAIYVNGTERCILSQNKKALKPSNISVNRGLETLNWAEVTSQVKVSIDKNNISSRCWDWPHTPHVVFWRLHTQINKRKIHIQAFDQ